MCLITGNQAYRLGRKSNFKKRLVARIRQRNGKRRRGNRVAAVFNVVQKGNNLVRLETEFGTLQHFTIFR